MSGTVDSRVPEWRRCTGGRIWLQTELDARVRREVAFVAVSALRPRIRTYPGIREAGPQENIGLDRLF